MYMYILHLLIFDAIIDCIYFSYSLYTVVVLMVILFFCVVL